MGKFCQCLTVICPQHDFGGVLLFNIMHIIVKNLKLCCFIPIGEWIHPKDITLPLKCFLPFQWGITLKGKKLLLPTGAIFFSFNSTPLL